MNTLVVGMWKHGTGGGKETGVTSLSWSLNAGRCWGGPVTGDTSLPCLAVGLMNLVLKARNGWKAAASCSFRATFQRLEEIWE